VEVSVKERKLYLPLPFFDVEIEEKSSKIPSKSTGKFFNEAEFYFFSDNERNQFVEWVPI